MKRWNIFIWKHYLIKEKRFKDGIILKKIDQKKQNEKDTRRKNYLSSGRGIRCREYERINITFINHHCERCSLRGKYTKSKIGREITHIFQMEEYQKEARRNVKSGEELKLTFQRNNETEGAFGDWKS